MIVLILMGLLMDLVGWPVSARGLDAGGGDDWAWCQTGKQVPRVMVVPGYVISQGRRGRYNLRKGGRHHGAEVAR